MHVFGMMYHQDGRLLATCEQMLIHVSLETRRACPPLPHVAERLAMIEKCHSRLPRPEGIGRAVGAAGRSRP